MIETKATYIAPEMEGREFSGLEAVLLGSDSPAFGYGDNDLGELT